MVARACYKYAPSIIVPRRRTSSDAVARVMGLAWDTETTGLGSDCEILQLGVKCVCTDDDVPKSGPFLRYVMPEGPIDRRAQAVHGISHDLLRQKGANPLRVRQSVLTQVLYATVAQCCAPVRCPSAMPGHRIQCFDRCRT